MYDNCLVDMAQELATMQEEVADKLAGLIDEMDSLQGEINTMINTDRENIDVETVKRWKDETRELLIQLASAPAQKMVRL